MEPNIRKDWCLVIAYTPKGKAVIVMAPTWVCGTAYDQDGIGYQWEDGYITGTDNKKNKSIAELVRRKVIEWLSALLTNNDRAMELLDGSAEVTFNVTDKKLKKLIG